jgi:hypothetical protein
MAKEDFMEFFRRELPKIQSESRHFVYYQTKQIPKKMQIVVTMRDIFDKSKIIKTTFDTNHINDNLKVYLRTHTKYPYQAFSQNLERTIRVYCEKGEIYGSSDKGKLHYTIFGDPEVKTEIIKFENDIYASHGGGDMGMVKAFTENYGKGKMSSEISQSMQSHYIGFAVQESSLQDGKIIYMDKR